MNILSIGNSFSEDAHRYLNQIAKSAGSEINAFNLFVGGCSLSSHHRFMLSGEKSYVLGVNGCMTGFKVSLKEALLCRDWDIITFQQASNCSPKYETYQPYLNKLAEYVRECVPCAKFVVHQTWAYEQDSHRLNVELGYKDQKDMFCDIKKAYEKAAKDINADFIIPSGEVFQKLLDAGVEKVHRDTFHAKLGIGRYALGLIWYMMLTGNDVENNEFKYFDEEISEEYIKIAKKCVKGVYQKYKI